MTQQKTLMVKDLPVEERPREKLSARGPKALSDAELLAILIRNGTKDDSAMRVAEKLLTMHKDRGIAALATLSVRDFRKIKGIGDAKAITIIAAIELGKRLAEKLPDDRAAVSTPKDVADYMMPRLRYESKEHFMAMMLNTKNHILAVPTISVGGLNASVVHPREVFREAVSHAAASIILVHNHPSGDPSPSGEDLNVTQMLFSAGDVMGIPVVDHIIIGDNRYVSLKEKGFIS